MAKTFEDLVVWQKAHALVLDVYRYSETFPRNETYGLSSQLRRAVVSVAANIVEGFAKKGTADKLRFYNIAQGSLEECKYYLVLSRDLGFGENNHLREKLYEVGRLLGAYIKAIKEQRAGSGWLGEMISTAGLERWGREAGRRCSKAAG